MDWLFLFTNRRSRRRCDHSDQLLCLQCLYSRITAVAPGTTLEYVASAFNGWQAVKIGSQIGWVSGEYSEITTE